MANAVDDRLIAKRGTQGFTGTQQDVDTKFYRANSGLTPPENFTLDDHKKEYFRVQLTLTVAQAAALSVNDLEVQFLETIGLLPRTNGLQTNRYSYYA